MGLTASDSGGGGDFELAPAGTHAARCVRIIDLGTQPGSAQYPKPKHKALFAWELPEETMEMDGERVPFLVFTRYTMSLHENAQMRQDLERWRGKAFSADELSCFELKRVLGAPCMITIQHSPDGKYANVRGVTSLPKGMQVAEPFHELVYYEVEDGPNDVFNKLSERLQDTIKSCPEWQQLHGNRRPAAVSDFGDDDIPF